MGPNAGRTEPDRPASRADLNGDGKIDSDDLSIFNNNWLKSIGQWDQVLISTTALLYPSEPETSNVSTRLTENQMAIRSTQMLHLQQSSAAVLVISGVL